MKFVSPYSARPDTFIMMLLPALASLPPSHRPSHLISVRAIRQFNSRKASLSPMRVVEGQQNRFYPQSIHDRLVYRQKRDQCS